MHFDLADLNAYAHQRTSGSHGPGPLPARYSEPIPTTGAPAVVNQRVALFSLDAAGTFTACEGAIGFATGATVGQSIFALYHDDPQSLDQVRRALAGETVTFVSHQRGTVVEQRLVPQREDAGRIIGLIGMATDVTIVRVVEEVRHSREKALWLAEVRALALLESAPDAIVVVDPNGAIVLANAQATLLFGYSRRALLGLPVEVLLPRLQRTAHMQYQAAPSTQLIGSDLDHYARRRDGSEFPVEVSLSPLNEGGQQLVTAVIRDVSARKAMEEELRASEARFRGLIQGAPVGVCVLDEHGVFEEVNERYAALLGYQPEELVGQHFQIVVSAPLRARAGAIFQQGLVGSPQRSLLEPVLLRKDGSIFTALGTVTLLQGRDEAPRFALFMLDIEERKREKRAVEEAHAFAEAMDRVSLLKGIAAAASRQQRLVEDLLDVNRAAAEWLRCERQPFALGRVLESAVAAVRDHHPDQIVALHGSDAAVAEGDAGRTQQILVKLLDNAITHSPEGSPVTVSWGLEEEQVVVRVRDHGKGIPEEGREHLFTRFQHLADNATRTGWSATGLNLYLSRLLAQAMGGELDLESTGLQGTVFRLLLPQALQT